MAFDLSLACVFQRVKWIVLLFYDSDRAIYSRRRGLKYRKVKNFCRSTAEPHGFTVKRSMHEAVRSAQRLVRTIVYR